jgi:phosphate transport system permease protein
LEAEAAAQADTHPSATKNRRSSWSLTRITDISASWLLAGAAAFLILGMAAVVLFLARPGVRTFSFVSPANFLAGRTWSPASNFFGAAPLWVGSLATSVLATAVAAPVGVISAVFIVEIGPPPIVRLLRSAVELFASIPSVVYGFLGLTLLVPALQRRPGDTGLGILPAGLVLAIMALPTIVTVSADALAAQPRARREAALALGATRWQSTWGVLVPAATPGIVAGVIFGFARAMGETMAVQMVIGNAAVMPRGITTPAATLSSEIVMEMANTIPGTPQNDVLFALALLLLVGSAVLIAIARRVARRAGGANA